MTLNPKKEASEQKNFEPKNPKLWKIPLGCMNTNRSIIFIMWILTSCHHWEQFGVIHGGLSGMFAETVSIALIPRE